MLKGPLFKKDKAHLLLNDDKYVIIELMMYISSKMEDKMYNIIFYRDKNGFSELLGFINDLNNKAATSKNERIMLKQIRFYINIIEKLGTRAGEPFVKHIQNGIWELRPGSNRILFFTWFENNIVLLHHFRKSTDKTPRSELERSVKKMEDWKERNSSDE